MATVLHFHLDLALINAEASTRSHVPTGEEQNENLLIRSKECALMLLSLHLVEFSIPLTLICSLLINAML